MPEHTQDGLDVSAEEQRFLRRSFHRFAWPWALGLMAFSWWISSGPPAGDASAELEVLRAQLGELSAALEGVSERAASAERRAAEAVALAGQLEERRDAGAAGKLDLERELRRAADRIAAVEKKLGGQPLSQRFDALSDRIAGVEERIAGGALPAAPAPGALPPPSAGRPLSPLPDAPR